MARISHHHRELIWERNISLLLYPCVHSLVDQCMCPSWGLNLNPWCIAVVLQSTKLPGQGHFGFLCHWTNKQKSESQTAPLPPSCLLQEIPCPVWAVAMGSLVLWLLVGLVNWKAPAEDLADEKKVELWYLFPLLLPVLVQIDVLLKTTAPLGSSFLYEIL